METSTVLIIGSVRQAQPDHTQGAGKSTCIELLKAVSKSGAPKERRLPCPVATAGVQSHTVQLPCGKAVELREVGGAVHDTWPAHLDERAVGAIVFLDANNRGAAAQAIVDLIDLVKHDRAATQAMNVALVISKADLPGALARSDIDWLCGLPELEVELGEQLAVIELAGGDAAALQRVAAFLERCLPRARVRSSQGWRRSLLR